MTDVTEKTAIRIAEGLEDVARAIHTYIDVQAGARAIGNEGAANSYPPQQDNEEKPQPKAEEKPKPKPKAKAEEKPKPKPAKPSKPAETKDASDTDSLDLGKEPIDIAAVKHLINTKLASGTNRKEIGKVLNANGISTISELTPADCPKVYSEIEAL